MKTPLRKILLDLYTRAKKTEASLPPEMTLPAMEAVRQTLETHRMLCEEEGADETAARYAAMLAVANAAQNEGDLIRLSKDL